MSDIGGVADGQLLVRYQIGQTQRIERERETESPLFLFTRSARQLVSFHGRFIKGGATKSSADAREGGESQTYPTNTEIWHPECQRVAGTAEEFQLYPILPEQKARKRGEEGVLQF